MHIMTSVDEVVDLIDGPVEHHGIDLGDGRANQRQYKRNHHQPFVGPNEGP